MALISIVIPLYNKEKWIQNTLKSALSQTFSDFEILIIDDGSTDNSAEIAKKITDKRIHYFHKENEGVSATRNFGIEKASGKYIAFLDADDFWHSTFLENMISMIAEYPNEKVFSAAIEVEIDGKIFKATYSISKDQQLQLVDFLEGSFDQTALFTSSAVFEKNVFEQAGNFDTSLKTGEDVDLWIRIGLLYKIVFSWEIGAQYREAHNSLSRNNIDYSEKPDFLKYEEFEKNHKFLSKYLDLNRFSMALKAKSANQKEQFIRFKNLIRFENLSWKQKILLNMPRSVLLKIYSLKTFLHKRNIRMSAFK